MKEYVKPTEQQVEKAAKQLVPLLERKRLLTAQYNWHKNPSIKEDLKEELEVVNMDLEKRYKLITDFYKRSGL